MEQTKTSSGRTTRIRIAATIILMTLLAAACGGSEVATPTSGVLQSSNGDIASCDLVGDDVLLAVIQEIVQPTDGLADELDAPELSECVYESSAGYEGPGNYDEISVGLYPSGSMADEFFDVEPVAGIGDQAHLDIVGRLWVRNGDTEFNISVDKTFNGVRDVTDEEELDVLMSIANNVLGNL